MTGQGAVALALPDRLVGLTDLAIWNGDGGPVLYAVGRGGSWLNRFSLGEGPGDTAYGGGWQVPTTYLQLESTQIVLRHGANGLDVLLAGLRDTDLHGRSDTGAGLVGQQPYDAGDFDMGRIADMALDGTGTTALAALQGGGLVQLRFDANDQISVRPTSTTGALAAATVDAVTVFSQDGVLYGVSVYGALDTVALLRLSPAGNFVQTDSVSVQDGAWMDAPGAVATITGGDGKTYVVVAASGSGSLTVFVAENGQLVPVHHLLDDLNTRFAHTAFVQAVVIGGQPYIIAAGSDQGVTVLALLPGGMLLPVATEAASLGTPINGLSGMTVYADGTTARIFLATQGAPYLVEMAFSLLNPGQIVTAAAGNASLVGGAGDDILMDQQGADTLSGGEGADVFVLGVDGVIDLVADFQRGIDQLVLQSPEIVADRSQLRILSRSWGADVHLGSEVLRVRSADGAPLTSADLDAVTLTLSPGIETDVAQYGDPGPDFGPETGNNLPPTRVPAPMPSAPVPQNEPLLMPTIATPLRGTAGQDTLNGSTASDQMLGGAGNDLIDGGVGNDILLGEAGFDTLYGGAGDDLLSGGLHADSMFGGDGADILVGGDGFDQIFGGNGNDRLWGGAAPDRLYGGDGDDWISAGSNFGYTVDGVFGGAGNDTLFGDAGFDLLYGGDGDDVLDGGHQADNLYGDAGADTIFGDAGFDRLFGGTGDDLLFGGDGPDSHFGMAGNDTMWGGEGTDRFYGGQGNDWINGGDGNDTLNGNAGFDTLIGGAGDDVLFGDFNADRFVFANGHGHDTVFGFDALNGLELLDFSGLMAFGSTTDVMDNARQDGSDVLILTGPDSSIRLVGVDLAQLDGTDFLF